ncbi:LLM class F420-dependent oxidoreductase [Mangrovimicrobium sediminis]|uniref:LLM class F420-dependent oxidoreductase n=1 Tax=Mangrovimicrobium sediminis TaxID=2562682 RepID=A0A4Z0M924_9GAMM|nr:LLM class F420-dependent oxidoreductase [Haliea sp. SAOS-164]TGD76031.1 LLM class F420-dependent oxidoreductase [Haliea sp. SAOS-164]
MRIGIFAGTTPDIKMDLAGVVAFAQDMESRGFDSLWLPNIFGLDAVGACAIAGWETDHIELGTAVTPSYPRHPAALAQQAMTTQAACGGRFTLGVGLSHRLVIEDMYGMSYDKPAKHMRQYLSVLAPLLRGEKVDYDGEDLSGHLQLDVPGAEPVPLLLAALGPTMLDLAGRYTHGTTTWMTGPHTIADHVVPAISEAASAGGHAAPRIVCGMPICLTRDVDAAREYIGKTLEIYGMLPSYRAMLDREGVEGPAELALVGDADTLRADIDQLRQAGVTDFNAAVMPFGDTFEATLELLQSELDS